MCMGVVKLINLISFTIMLPVFFLFGVVRCVSFSLCGVISEYDDY